MESKTPIDVSKAGILAICLGLLGAYGHFISGSQNFYPIAGCICVTTTLLAILYPTRWYFWAIALGIWIPIVEISIAQRFHSLIVFTFAFAGSVVGLFVRCHYRTPPSLEVQKSNALHAFIHRVSFVAVGVWLVWLTPNFDLHRSTSSSMLMLLYLFLGAILGELSKYRTHWLEWLSHLLLERPILFVVACFAVGIWLPYLGLGVMVTMLVPGQRELPKVLLDPKVLGRCLLVLLACGLIVVFAVLTPLARVDSTTSKRIAPATIDRAISVVGVPPGMYDGILDFRSVPSNDKGYVEWTTLRGDLVLVNGPSIELVEVKLYPVKIIRWSAPKYFWERITRESPYVPLTNRHAWWLVVAFTSLGIFAVCSYKNRIAIHGLLGLLSCPAVVCYLAFSRNGLGLWSTSNEVWFPFLFSSPFIGATIGIVIGLLRWCCRTKRIKILRRSS